MHIFIFIPAFHPAYKAGGPIQSIANMVEKLAVGSGQWVVGKKQLAVESGQWAGGTFQFSVFCSNKDLDGTILNSVPYDQWVQHNANTRVWYTSDNKIIPVLEKEISKSFAKPDLFYIIGIYDWNYNFKPLNHFKDIPKIISVRGMLHPGALSQKGFKKKVYLSLWKLLGWHKKYRFHVTDETERGYVKKVFGDSVRINVAGNFPMLYERMSLPVKRAGELRMVSVCLISPMKNVKLVLESLVGSRESLVEGRELEGREGTKEREDRNTKITKDHEDNEEETASFIEYNIYGPVKDEKYWNSCLEVIKKMPTNINVKYHGEIPPAEIGKVLSQHHVFILPSRSENYGHAIIEALSAGLPVITSYGTPWNALEEEMAGVNAGTDDIIDLVNGIDKFAGMGQEEFVQWSEGAHRYAVRRVDVEKTVGEYVGMFGVKS